MRHTTDIAILGAGLAGLTLALQLRNAMPDAHVTVLDRRHHPAPQASHKVGESLVEVSSWYLREVLGMGNYLREHHIPKFGLRFFMTDGDNKEIATRPEYGLLKTPINLPEIPCETYEGMHLPTYNVDRGMLENYLFDRCKSEGVDIHDNVKIKSVHSGKVHHIHTSEDETVAARWVVDTTGRAGIFARQMQLRQSEEHRVNAAWFRVNGRINLDEWTQDASFHDRTQPQLRWRSTNHFMGPGYWIWMIPLPNACTSVGIMIDPDRYSVDQIDRYERVIAWLHEKEPVLAEHIQALGTLDFQVMKTQSYRSKRTFSPDRWALSGEAAFYSDALYSPGGDFIAVNNTLIAQMIEADFAGDRLRLAILARFGEHLLNGMFDNYIGLYRYAYATMGCPKKMIQKVAWDTASYFGYNVFLFCNNRLCDPEFHKMIRNENMEFTRLQQMMLHTFKQPEQQNDTRFSGRFVDQAQIEPIQELYWSSHGCMDTQQLKVRLGKNMKLLHHFGQHINTYVS